jgi:hypothetical protein
MKYVEFKKICDTCEDATCKYCYVKKEIDRFESEAQWNKINPDDEDLVTV